MVSRHPRRRCRRVVSLTRTPSPPRRASASSSEQPARAGSSGSDFRQPGSPPRRSVVAIRRPWGRVGLASTASIFVAATCAPDPPPPPPDYGSPSAWAAWPGRASAADALPPGVAEVPASDRPADVFFVHPTTYFGAAPNARFDEPGGARTRLEQGVLRFQVSAFNGCCRAYVPRYRQAALAAFLKKNEETAQRTAAYELAYGDVRRAFDYYLAHENHGRPFILASHSQGSLHAMRLLEERIAGTPLQAQLVAAYLIGYAMPEEIERTGVLVCHAARETRCLIDWNTVAADAGDDRRGADRLVWLAGHYQPLAARRGVCVNPLSWVPDSAADASLNLGALPAVAPGEALRPSVPQLTGARCDAGRLRVSIPWSERRGFANLLTFFGSYHVFDYNLFYSNIRVNAAERVAAYRAAPAAAR